MRTGDGGGGVASFEELPARVFDRAKSHDPADFLDESALADLERLRQLARRPRCSRDQ